MESERSFGDKLELDRICALVHCGQIHGAQIDGETPAGRQAQAGRQTRPLGLLPDQARLGAGHGAEPRRAAELEPRKNIVSKGIREKNPSLFQRLMSEQERVCGLIARRRAVELLQVAGILGGGARAQRVDEFPQRVDVVVGEHDRAVDIAILGQRHRAVYQQHRTGGGDAEVRSWVRADVAELDGPLHAAVSRWLVERWPFERVIYADRPMA